MFGFNINMQVQFNQYRYNNYYNVNSSTPVSFKAKVNTMPEKLNILLAETKKLYKNKQNVGIRDFSSIIEKISPITKIKYFSEIPLGSNISPRTGAYFSQRSNIDFQRNEIKFDDKVIYLNFNNQTSQSKLKLFADFVHEATHIAQEEATDRVTTADFIKKFLSSPVSIIEKDNSLLTGVQGFKSVEYNILLPLIDAWRKTDDLPREVMHTDKKILDMIYKSQTNLSTQEYIKAVTVDILKQLKTKLPYANENYVLRYIRKKAGQEKEAYQISLDFLKDILNIKGHTDLDYRILLYDEFEKAIDSMLK